MNDKTVPNLCCFERGHAGEHNFASPAQSDGIPETCLAEEAVCAEPALHALMGAAALMDWQQVVLNGGPPCFHLEADGSFCGRAWLWDGHDGRHADVGHEFVSLCQLVAQAALAGEPA